MRLVLYDNFFDRYDFWPKKKNPGNYLERSYADILQRVDREEDAAQRNKLLESALTARREVTRSDPYAQRAPRPALLLRGSFAPPF